MQYELKPTHGVVQLIFHMIIPYWWMEDMIMI